MSFLADLRAHPSLWTLLECNPTYLQRFLEHPALPPSSRRQLAAWALSRHLLAPKEAGDWIAPGFIQGLYVANGRGGSCRLGLRRLETTAVEVPGLSQVQEAGVELLFRRGLGFPSFLFDHLPVWMGDDESELLDWSGISGSMAQLAGLLAHGFLCERGKVTKAPLRLPLCVSSVLNSDGTAGRVEDFALKLRHLAGERPDLPLLAAAAGDLHELDGVELAGRRLVVTPLPPEVVEPGLLYLLPLHELEDLVRLLDNLSGERLEEAMRREAFVPPRMEERGKLLYDHQQYRAAALVYRKLCAHAESSGRSDRKSASYRRMLLCSEYLAESAGGNLRRCHELLSQLTEAGEPLGRIEVKRAELLYDEYRFEDLLAAMELVLSGTQGDCGPEVEEPACFQASRAWRALGQPEKALPLINRAIALLEAEDALHPSLPHRLNERACQLYEAGHHAEAETSFAACADLADRSFPGNAFNRMYLLYNQALLFSRDEQKSPSSVEELVANYRSLGFHAKSTFPGPFGLLASVRSYYQAGQREAATKALRLAERYRDRLQPANDILRLLLTRFELWAYLLAEHPREASLHLDCLRSGFQPFAACRHFQSVAALLDAAAIPEPKLLLTYEVLLRY